MKQMKADNEEMKNVVKQEVIDINRKLNRVNEDAAEREEK